MASLSGITPTDFMLREAEEINYRSMNPTEAAFALDQSLSNQLFVNYIIFAGGGGYPIALIEEGEYVNFFNPHNMFQFESKTSRTGLSDVVRMVETIETFIGDIPSKQMVAGAIYKEVDNAINGSKSAREAANDLSRYMEMTANNLGTQYQNYISIKDVLGYIDSGFRILDLDYYGYMSHIGFV